MSCFLFESFWCDSGNSKLLVNYARMDSKRSGGFVSSGGDESGWRFVWPKRLKSFLTDVTPWQVMDRSERGSGIDWFISLICLLRWTVLHAIGYKFLHNVWEMDTGQIVGKLVDETWGSFICRRVYVYGYGVTHDLWGTFWMRGSWRTSWGLRGPCHVARPKA